MDRFPDWEHVRLRNRVFGTYLHADANGASISLSLRRASMNVAWAVHIYHDAWGTAYVLLQGAAYGLYLGCTGGFVAGRGHRGVHVVQCEYDVPERDEIMWQVSVSESGDDVLLRHVDDRGYLRANGNYPDGGYLRANGNYPDGVPDGGYLRPTVDDGNRSIMMRWVVEPIPARVDRPGLAPPQIVDPLPIDHFIRRIGMDDPDVIQPPWRLIRFVPASAHGSYDDNGWTEVQFRGNSIFHLRNWMVIEVTKLTTGLPAGVTEEDLYAQLFLLETEIVMCVRAGRYARLCPMLVDLPGDGRYGETIYIVAIMTGTPAEAQLRYPDINAE